MILKLLCLYLLLVEKKIVFLSKIPIESLVRLSCDHCQKKTNHCCIGTLISDNVALTTSFCANSCQRIEINRSIIKVTVHPNYVYRRGKTVLRNNDIALLHFIDDQTKRRYVKLSSVDYQSTVGLKALVLILEDKPRLKVTIIQRCSNSMKGYLCTSNIKHYQSIEGIPLFLDGRLLGITTKMNKTICQSPAHTVFTPVTPALDWIYFMINNQHISFTAKPFNALRYKDKFTIRKRTFKKRTKTTKTVTSLTTAESVTDQSKLEERYFKDRNNTTLDLIGNTTKSNNNETLVNYTVHVDKMSSPFAIGTRSSSNKLASVRPVSSSTSAMDWFNSNYKSKIMKNSPAFLVLTTSPRVYVDGFTEFVDLT